MPSIAIIDDNLEMSGSLQTILKQHLENLEIDWDVITLFPFSDLNKYFEFIESNEIYALILDEKLNTRSNDDNTPVDYLGSQLVSVLRKRLKDFPIFSITTYPNEDELKDNESEFEFILPREDFANEGSKYVPIIVRAANRYLDSNQRELLEFCNLAKEIAGGNADLEKKERLEILQLKLELPYDGFSERNNWLEEYSHHIKELEKLKEEIQRYLLTE